MTHDELLARIIGAPKKLTDLFPKTVEAHLMPNTKALRAVVELHKPLDSLWYKQIICESCQEGNDYPITYPCETIQAIEKELI